jgi:hypothetical protein
MTREEKMNKRREAGKIYQYKPNPFPKDSVEYLEETVRRAEKNQFKTPGFAKLRSFYAKLDYQLSKRAKEIKKKTHEAGNARKSK